MWCAAWVEVLEQSFLPANAAVSTTVETCNNGISRESEKIRFRRIALARDWNRKDKEMTLKTKIYFEKSVSLRRQALSCSNLTAAHCKKFSIVLVVLAEKWMVSESVNLMGWSSSWCFGPWGSWPSLASHTSLMMVLSIISSCTLSSSARTNSLTLQMV